MQMLCMCLVSNPSHYLFILLRHTSQVPGCLQVVSALCSKNLYVHLPITAKAEGDFQVNEPQSIYFLYLMLLSGETEKDVQGCLYLQYSGTSRASLLFSDVLLEFMVLHSC